MDILARIARHCLPALQPTDLLLFPPEPHLIWQGQFKPKRQRLAQTTIHPPRNQYLSPTVSRQSRKDPRPYLNGPNCNPVRILFDYPTPLDRFVLLTNQCGNPACINRHHYSALGAVSKKTGVAAFVPRPRTKFDEQSVQDILELFDDEPDLQAMSHPLDWAEALRRRPPP